MMGQLRNLNINMNSVCACVYVQTMWYILFHVLGSTNFQTKEQSINLT